MTIRPFQQGDEEAQVGIYNEAAAVLPKFKVATLDEVRRRCKAAEFDPSTRFFAEEEGIAVGYSGFHSNGRVSYPWCRAGHQKYAEPLFDTVLDAMRKRGLTRAFAAYRADWPGQQEFFLQRGFQRVREMVSYWLDPADMPTPAARKTHPIGPVEARDIPAIFNLCPQLLRVNTLAGLEKHLLQNPYFSPDSVFALRSRNDGTIAGAGVLVLNPAYANVQQLDASMPCFRLGAFGTEGMQVKRVNGLLSFILKDGRDMNQIAFDLMGHAAFRLHQTDVSSFAAQVPSDVPHLFRFYQQQFRRQGSFPILERVL